MDHPECFERLLELNRSGRAHEGKVCVHNSVGSKAVSSEDVEARTAAQSFLDGHLPMAFETAAAPVEPVKQKRTRLDPRARACKAGYARAMKLAEKDNRRIAREQAKVDKAGEKVRAAAQKKQDTLEAAEGPKYDLPAVVLRDGLVKSVDLATALELADAYRDALCVDVEHSGYDIGHRDYFLKTIQLGGEEMAVVLDGQDPQQKEIASFALRAARKLHAHSATADIIPLVKAGVIGYDEAWDKMVDSVLIAKLTDPKMSGSDANGLKDLAQDLLREYATAPAAEKAKNELFRAMGCLLETDSLTPVERNGWHQVNPRCETMIRYAGSDVLDLAAVLRMMPPLPVDESVLEREREFEKICARVALDGFPLDEVHIEAKVEEHEKSQAEHRQNVRILSNGTIENPSSPDTGEKILALYPGAPLNWNESKDKKTGAVVRRPSADKKSLSRVTEGEAAVTAGEILAYRHDVTTLGLLLRPLNTLCKVGDGRMRPTVLTINADTGRSSCVRPNGQQFCYDSATDILTEYGFVPFPEVDGSQKVAQWSPDGSIEFVYPEAVLHEGYDGPMIRITGEHHEQVVTPDHRVYSFQRKSGGLSVETASAWLERYGDRERIIDRRVIRGGYHRTGTRLTAEEMLSLRRAIAVQADAHYRDDCRFLSLKLTKERKIERAAQELGLEVRRTPNTAGGKAIYEAKAYDHQVTRWISIPDKNFRISELLKLDEADLRQFIAEVMFWDGDSTREQEYSQAKERSASVEAVEAAAILCGYSTTRRTKPAAGELYDCSHMFPSPVRHASRTSVTEVPSDGMIHCVTVPSGAVVTRHGGKIVVSGNSRQGGIRKSVVADEGYVMVNADFQGCEIRVAAALSGDRGLLEAETSNKCHLHNRPTTLDDLCDCGLKDDGEIAGHTGLHWLAAHLTFGEGATKENRYKSKAVIFRKLFGGAPDSDVAQKISDTFDNQIAPVYASWDKWLRKSYYEGSMVWRDYQTGKNHAQKLPGSRRGIYRTYNGRNIYINAPHAFGNYAIQGTARELLVEGIIRWHAQTVAHPEWEAAPVLPIHDEVMSWVIRPYFNEAVSTLRKCMATDVLSVPGWNVPIDADPELKQYTYWPDSS